MLLLPTSLLLALFALLSLSQQASALDAAGWRSQSIYQVITDRFARPSNVTETCNVADRLYCGGTYSALIDKLDYIQGMGFSAIWISPVVSNIGGTTPTGEAYHGYWSLDISKLNTNFGDASSLKALSDALHARGMYLMVDIVVNHVAATASSTFETSSAYGSFDEQSDFHSFCWINDYTNQTDVEQCWLGDENVALPDIDTEDDTVVSYYNAWVKQLVSDYSIDGLRIDTVKHVRKDFWPAFVASSGVYTVGEVLDGGVSYVAPYTDVMDGILDYVTYYQLTYAFQATNGSIADLVTAHDELKTGVNDTTLLGKFLDNHDQPRFASFVSDETLIANAMAYPFVSDGIPILYQGQEQGYTGGADPANREPMWTSDYSTTASGYGWVSNLTAVRSAAGNASSSFYTSKSSIAGQTEHEIIISKSPLVSILSNRGSSGQQGSVLVPANASLPSSSSVVDVVSCTSWTTGSHGASTVTVSEGKPILILPQSDLGSLCPGGVTASTTNTASEDDSSSSSSSGSSGSSDGGSSAGERTTASGKWTVAFGFALVGLMSASL